MKFFITTTLLLLLPTTSALAQRSKHEYLKGNRFDLNQLSAFPQKQFTIIGFGAYHGSAKTEDASYLLLQSLVKNQQVKYYLPETDFSIATYLTKYLTTGDTILLKDLISYYGRLVPQERSIEVYTYWKKIKFMNDGQDARNKISVVGIDRITNYKYTARHLISLITTKHTECTICDALKQMVLLDTTDYSPNYDSYSKKILQRFVSDFEDKSLSHSQLIEDSIAFNHIVRNLKYTFSKSFREKVIFDNYVSLAKRFDFQNNPQFARFGFSHLEKTREEGIPSFFTQLIENGIYKPDEVISVLGYLTTSEVLWDTHHDTSGKYTGYSIEKGFGIGDYWKEYFKGISYLKKNRLSDLTLFRLNQPASPYRKNNTTDLIKVKMFLKKSNGSAVKGKATTDFVDYAVLISDSKASRPLEELNKH
jgi:hypothetical protein